MNYLKNTLITLCTTLLTVNSVLAEEDKSASVFPSYKDGKLTIPRIDTDLQAGNYQDVELQLNTTTGAWELINYRETLITPDPPKYIYLNSVEIIKQGGVPVQIFLKVFGDFSNGCGGFKQINQRIEGNRFVITIHTFPIPAGMACTLSLVPFEKIVPLNVYGLTAGTYEYSVNGEHNGSFTLTQDNHL